MQVSVFSRVFEKSLILEIDDPGTCQVIEKKLQEKVLVDLLKRREDLREAMAKEVTEDDAEDVRWLEEQIKNARTVLGVE